MKKLANLFLGIAAAAAFTACSSTEEVTAPGAAKGDVTVTVVTDAAMQSRAGIATLTGYDFQCTMQLVGDNGETIGTQAVADASAGTASFTIKAADIDAGATKAIFWAGYTATGTAQNVYNTADLTNVTYAVTAFDMTDANLMGAADAFAGALTTLENGAQVTLSRPMIQFNFKPVNPEAAAGATALEVKYEATSGYNVLTSNCTATYQELTYTNAAFAPEAAGNWFTSMIFAPANLTKFDKEIVMTLTGTATQTLTIPAGTLPMDANYIVNTTAEITAAEDQDLNVNVSINDYFENEPKPAVFELGAYLNAAGEPVNTAEEAVAVVFYVGAMDGDVIANYPAEFAGKTIKGYAIAKENTSTSGLSFGLAADVNFESNETSGYTNGTQATAAFVTACNGNEFITSYNTWTTANAMTGSNTTAWYLPLKAQLRIFYNTIYCCDDADGSATPTDADVLGKLFSTENIWGTADPTANVMVSTSTVNAQNKPSGARLLFAGDHNHFTMKQIDTAKDNQKALCRPMITIFE